MEVEIENYRIEMAGTEEDVADILEAALGMDIEEEGEGEGEGKVKEVGEGN